MLDISKEGESRVNLFLSEYVFSLQSKQTDWLRCVPCLAVQVTKLIDSAQVDFSEPY